MVLSSWVFFIGVTASVIIGVVVAGVTTGIITGVAVVITSVATGVVVVGGNLCYFIFANHQN